jgi:hypothetical protein
VDPGHTIVALVIGMGLLDISHALNGLSHLKPMSSVKSTATQLHK